MNLAWAVRISGDGGQEGRHLAKKRYSTCESMMAQGLTECECWPPTVDTTQLYAASRELLADIFGPPEGRTGGCTDGRACRGEREGARGDRPRDVVKTLFLNSVSAHANAV